MRNSCEELLPSFSPEDVRQFVYCPRIIYFRYVLRCQALTSGKMLLGTKSHEKWKNRSKRRLDEKTRYYGVYLNAQDIGLFGLLDALDYDGVSAKPVELKTGHPPQTMTYNHHKAQLLAECLLLEVTLSATVESGIIIYESNKSEVSINYGDAERLWVDNILSDMREIISDELIPEPTEVTAKCVDCEYMGVCQRI